MSDNRERQEKAAELLRDTIRRAQREGFALGCYAITGAKAVTAVYLRGDDHDPLDDEIARRIGEAMKAATEQAIQDLRDSPLRVLVADGIGPGRRLEVTEETLVEIMAQAHLLGWFVRSMNADRVRTAGEALEAVLCRATPRMRAIMQAFGLRMQREDLRNEPPPSAN